jgi:hypothetical protein
MKLTVCEFPVRCGVPWGVARELEEVLRATSLHDWNPEEPGEQPPGRRNIFIFLNILVTLS